MKRLMTIGLLVLAAGLAGCNPPPPPQNPEMLVDGPFPNLADVPARPKIMSISEREQLQRDLLNNNKAGQSVVIEDEPAK